MKTIITSVIFLFFVYGSYAQVFSVSGKVVDADTRHPLPFVNIVINDGYHGGTSDIDGKFSFRSPDEIEFLSLSYVGYETLRYTVNKKNKNLFIKLKKTEYELPEYVVFPSENPAHRIIKNAVTYRDFNDSEKLPAFSYTSYDKMIFTIEPDSLPDIDSISADTSDMEVRDFFEKQHIWIMETVSERKFMFPDRNSEEVIATKIAGFKDPIFVFLLSQMQSTTFYKEIITIADKNYINPISKGSTKKYFFLLQDTIYSGNSDSVFIISFRPRINTNFDGLKGVISINTNNWAIQNVIAEPAGVEEGISLKVEQMYEFVDSMQWFPVQLNTIAIINNVVVSDSSQSIMLGSVKDTTGGKKVKSIPFGFGKSYIKNINLNPELRKRDFGSVVVEVDPEATHRKAEFWSDYRIDSLTQKEINTYRFVDSVSKAENFEKKIKVLESLMTGKIPWGHFDLDINRFLNYNSYEGFALGAGLHTNQRISQVFNVGGFVRYGFKDKAFKYGGDLGIIIHNDSELELNLKYMNDVTETSGVTFFDDKPGFFKPEYFRDLLIKRMDKTELYKVSLGVRALNYLKLNVGLTKSNKVVTDDYRYAISEENINVYFNSYDFTEATVGFKYAYGEKFIKNLRKKISMGTKYPVLWFQYTRGISGFLNGDFDYNRFDVKIEKSFYTKYFGETSLKLAAGYVDSDIPYTNLYNGNGAYRAFTIFAENSFATMRMNEFLSNKYVALYFTHDFGKLLYQGERFKPEFAFATNVAFGWLDFADSHHNIEYKTLDKGYYESGILVNRLLNLRLYTLGLGVFYRYGPYTFKNGWDNVAGKITIKFPF